MRAIAPFPAAGRAGIGGGCLVWEGMGGGGPRGVVGVGGAGALIAYGILASLQHDPHFGRVLAAYGGVFVFGSLLWGVLFDGFRPHRSDLLGAGICVAGATLIMYR